MISFDFSSIFSCAKTYWICIALSLTLCIALLCDTGNGRPKRIMANTVSRCRNWPTSPEASQFSRLLLSWLSWEDSVLLEEKTPTSHPHV